MSKRFLDEDVLVYKQQQGRNDNHVAKRKQRNKGLEIVFDPKSHKEYITGFRKRKQQRRKEAVKILEKKQRQQRIEERAERRKSFKASLNLDKYEQKDDDDNDSGEDQPKVQTFKTGQLTSTVTIEPIRVGSESELDGDEEEDDNNIEMPSASAARKEEKRRIAAQTANEAAAVLQQPTKLSSTSLRIMTKTKLKIEGKKIRHAKSGGKAGGGKGGGSGKRKGGGRKGGRR